MKVLKSLFILIIIIVPVFILPIVVIVTSHDQINTTKILLTSENGVSNYETTQSVTYQVQINFSLIHHSGPVGNYSLKFSRLNDRQPNSTLTQYCGPYQESELQYSSIIGSDNDPFIYRDRFNNTYDIFNASYLSPSETITLNQQYEVTLNEVFFNNINPSEIGIYDTSDDIFSLYCNNSELYYEKDDININATSHSIVNPSDNPVVKAQKICDWVVDHLTYDDSLEEEKGAKWAYDNEMGDCSEYSSLMITLLRCQGIPARKVTGFVISDDPTKKPYVGQELSFFSRSGDQTNIIGHAWVEYYVPNIGWIACDPTWDETGDYFNRIDYVRLNFNIGAWFSIPSPFIPDKSEFPHPCLVYMLSSTFDYEYILNLKVVSINLNIPELVIIIIVIGVILTGLTIGIIFLIVRSRKKRSINLSY